MLYKIKTVVCVWQSSLLPSSPLPSAGDTMIYCKTQSLYFSVYSGGIEPHARFRSAGVEN